MALGPLSAAAQTADPLASNMSYSGSLTNDCGQPLNDPNGKAFIYRITNYDPGATAPPAAGAPEDPGEICRVEVTASITNGRFRIPLSEECAGELNVGSMWESNTNLDHGRWVQLTVSGTTLPATPVGLTGPAVNGVPSGTMMIWPTYTTRAPEGWVAADGSSYPKVGRYSRLFNVYRCGHGCDDDDHFRVPDMRGRFIRGVDTAAGTIDPDVMTRTQPCPSCLVKGANQSDPGSVQDWATARPKTAVFGTSSYNHSHNIERRPQATGAAGGFNVGHGSAENIETTGDTHSHDIVSGGDAETRPTNVGMNFIIKL